MSYRHGWPEWQPPWPPSWGQDGWSRSPPEANGWGRQVASGMTEHHLRIAALEERADKHGTEIDGARTDHEALAKRVEHLEERRQWLASLPWGQILCTVAAVALGLGYIAKTGNLPPWFEKLLGLAGSAAK